MGRLFPVRWGLALCVGLSMNILWAGGDAGAESALELGKRVAREHCSRCHVVDASNRMGGIGSTPSFKLLCSLPDWEDRFTTFFARQPHPAIITVEGISEDRKLPPNAAPILLTQDQVEALMAYVRVIKQAQ